jgi:hypothetical protein
MIARRLNANAVPKSDHCDSVWRASLVRSILNNPIYCGKMIVVQGLVDGIHEPLVPEELLQQAQDLIQARLDALVLDAIRDYSTSDLLQSLSTDAVMKEMSQDAPAIEEEQFRSRNEALLKKKQDLQQKLAEAEARSADREAVELSVAQVKQMLMDFDRVWERMGLEEQREMLRDPIEELKVGKGQGELKLLFLPAIELRWPTRGKA